MNLKNSASPSWRSTQNQLDLDGDDNFNETDELDEVRTHNDVNEIGDRDIDNDETLDFSLTYNAPGCLTDDGEDYEYEYDAFLRLRKVKRTDNQALVSEFKYNGLGFRISSHQDTEPDGDVDGDDEWYHFAYDEGWRMVATYRENDANPKERFVHHQAGDSGYGGSSYIDLIAFREKDANTAWTSASDGTLEERVYLCQNWRADVSVVVTAGGAMKEWVKFSSYGTPIAEPFGDTNSDGDRDGADQTQIDTWYNSDPPVYNVRGDVDLDGDVDATDEAAVAFSTVTMGREVLSDVGNRRGYAGYESDALGHNRYHVRHRVCSIGHWKTRDPLEYEDGLSLYQYVRSNPVRSSDPSGLGSVKNNASSSGGAFVYYWGKYKNTGKATGSTVVAYGKTSSPTVEVDNVVVCCPVAGAPSAKECCSFELCFYQECIVECGDKGPTMECDWWCPKAGRESCGTVRNAINEYNKHAKTHKHRPKRRR